MFCTAVVPEGALPQAAGAQFFSLGDDDVEAPAAVRPDRWGYKRHCGSGFELVLDVTGAAARERTGGSTERRVSGRRAERSHSSSWWWAFQNSSWRSSRFTPRTGSNISVLLTRAGSVSIACASGGVHLTYAGSVSITYASCGIHLSRASSVSTACASGGVHLSYAGSVPSDCASGGVFLTRASRVPGDSASGGIFLTRASRVSSDSSSGGAFLTRARPCLKRVHQWLLVEILKALSLDRVQQPEVELLPVVDVLRAPCHL